MKAIINGEEMALEKKNGNWHPLGIEELDIQKLDKKKLFLVADGKPVTVSLLEIDKAKKKLEVLANGVKYSIQIKEPLDELLASMGLDKATEAGISNIKAPMPGLVLSVEVEPGAHISKGDKLLVLEAMKMENVIKAPGDGVISKILVNKGQTVDKNQILIEF